MEESATRLLEKKVEHFFCNIGMDKDFLKWQKVKTIKEINDEINDPKIKDF